MNTQKTLAISIIGILSAALVWVLFFWNPVVENTQGNANKSNSSFLSQKLSEKPTGGDFTVDAFNKKIALKDLRGKVVVLYFGYTQCPDICPTSLALLTQALNQMDEKELSNMQSIFISVDPNRDNTERLNEYAKYFHKNIIGATAKKEVIDSITKSYGAAYRVVESDSAMGYIVDHSSYTYVIDKEGKLQHALPHASSPVKILEAIRGLLAE